MHDCFYSKVTKKNAHIANLSTYMSIYSEDSTLCIVINNRNTTTYDHLCYSQSIVYGWNLLQKKLPEFSGEHADWNGFIALFDRMVHYNDTINKGLKIGHLKTWVKGSAARIINHIDPTPENYDTCYALLQKRYDECQLTNVREPQSLKSMLTYIENRFMALQSAAAKQETRNDWVQLLDNFETNEYWISRSISDRSYFILFLQKKI